MRQLPRAARAYIWAIWVVGVAVLAHASRGLAQSPPANWGALLLQAALFVVLAVVADLKQLRLGGANYSVATATNFACVIVLGPHAATWVGALGALVGDVAMRKPAHKVAFNTSTLAASVAAGGAVLAAVRGTPHVPVPSDLPAFAAYTGVNSVVNLALVCTVIALATGQRLSGVLAANYRGLGVPMIAVYPLGVLMAIVYVAFGGWFGLLLLVLPVIAAYAALEHARQLRFANQELQEAAAQKADLYAQLSASHERLKETQAQVLEQERLRALGQMASGIAHDFNNALAPIVGFTELLLLQPERWKDDDYMRRTLRFVHTAGQDASQVVRQLREFYRKSDAEELLLPLDLSTLARQVVDITEPRWRGQALAAGATITVSTDLADLPPILGDEAALREALTNLVFNAVDAMPNGGQITVRTASRSGQALLEVADSGTGMSDDVRRRCLDPFFTTKGVHGTGMGLSMVHGIVRRHGGTIEIDSVWGRGTTVRLVLPGCASQQPAAPEGLPVAGAVDGADAVEAAGSEPARRPLHVLLVDDEPGVRDVLSAYVTSYGYIAETAANGHEGLVRFRECFRADGPGGQTAFDVVVTDRAMPEMNGDHLARAIKQLDATVPVVMVTGFGDMLNALDQTPAGVDAVIGKPVSHAALRETLDRLTTTQLPAQAGGRPCLSS